MSDYDDIILIEKLEAENEQLRKDSKVLGEAFEYTKKKAQSLQQDAVVTEVRAMYCLKCGMPKFDDDMKPLDECIGCKLEFDMAKKYPRREKFPGWISIKGADYDGNIVTLEIEGRWWVNKNGFITCEEQEYKPPKKTTRFTKWAILDRFKNVIAKGKLTMPVTADSVTHIKISVP